MMLVFIIIKNINKYYKRNNAFITITGMTKSIIGKTFLADDNATFSNLDIKILQSCDKFYHDDENDERIKKMIKIILRKSVVSSRILEWFLCNYCLEKVVVYPLTNNKLFNVHNSYRSQLKEYRKHRFDPFCRKYEKNKIYKLTYVYRYNSKEQKLVIEPTSVGQLNFYKWAISNGVLDYIEENLSSIVKHMKSKTGKNKKKNKASEDVRTVSSNIDFSSYIILDENTTHLDFSSPEKTVRKPVKRKRLTAPNNTPFANKIFF